jgi:hypothetical protein
LEQNVLWRSVGSCQHVPRASGDHSALARLDERIDFFAVAAADTLWVHLHVWLALHALEAHRLFVRELKLGRVHHVKDNRFVTAGLNSGHWIEGALGEVQEVACDDDQTHSTRMFDQLVE